MLTAKFYTRDTKIRPQGHRQMTLPVRRERPPLDLGNASLCAGEGKGKLPRRHRLGDQPGSLGLDAA